MPCSGCKGAIPRHHALHLDRVWWTSPPVAYKYKGKEEEEKGFFLEKRGKQAGETKKKEKAKTDVGSEKQRLQSLHKEEEESSSPPGHHRCFFLSTTTSSTGSNRQQNEGKREWKIGAGERRKGKRIEYRGWKKQIKERRTITSLSDLSLRRLEPLAAAPFFFLAVTSGTARDHRRQGRILLIEWMKNRGRRNTKVEERRRRTTVCHHSRPPRQQRHRDQHREPSMLPGQFPSLTSSPVALHCSAWTVESAPLFTGSFLSGPVQKKNQKYFKKNLWFTRVFFLLNFA